MYLWERVVICMENIPWWGQSSGPSGAVYILSVKVWPQEPTSVSNPTDLQLRSGTAPQTVTGPTHKAHAPYWYYNESWMFCYLNEYFILMNHTFVYHCCSFSHLSPWALGPLGDAGLQSVQLSQDEASVSPQRISCLIRLHLLPRPGTLLTERHTPW